MNTFAKMATMLTAMAVTLGIAMWLISPLTGITLRDGLILWGGNVIGYSVGLWNGRGL